MEVVYTIDGVNLKTGLGVRVAASYGLLSTPAFKEPLKSEFADEHGFQPDLSEPVLESREIELECSMSGTDASDLISKLTALETALTSPGLKQLICTPGTGHPLAYLVYLVEGINPVKRWKDGKMIATFSLKFVEPEPKKIYGKIIVTSPSGEAVTIQFTGVPDETAILVHWGDNQSDRLVIDNVDTDIAEHTYAEAGTYYVVITGRLTGITTECIGRTDFEIYPVYTW